MILPTKTAFQNHRPEKKLERKKDRRRSRLLSIEEPALEAMLETNIDIKWINRRQLSTEVALMLLNQLPQVRSLAIPVPKRDLLSSTTYLVDSDNRLNPSSIHLGFANPAGWVS